MLRWLLIQNRQGKTRLAKFYVPMDDDEKVRLKGEVHRLVAPRDQKYQSNFVEVGGCSFAASKRKRQGPVSAPHRTAQIAATMADQCPQTYICLRSFPPLHNDSTATTRLSTGGMPVSSFAYVSMQTTTSSLISRQYTCSSRCWTRSLVMSASSTSSSTFTR